MHSSSRPKDTNQGPLTRSRAKKLQEEVNSFLIDFDFNTSKDVILPKSSTLMLLRCTHEEVEGTDDQDQDQGFHHLFRSDKKRTRVINTNQVFSSSDQSDKNGPI